MFYNLGAWFFKSAFQVSAVKTCKLETTGITHYILNDIQQDRMLSLADAGSSEIYFLSLKHFRTSVKLFRSIYLIFIIFIILTWDSMSIQEHSFSTMFIL